MQQILLEDLLLKLRNKTLTRKESEKLLQLLKDIEDQAALNGLSKFFREPKDSNNNSRLKEEMYLHILERKTPLIRMYKSRNMKLAAAAVAISILCIIGSFLYPSVKVNIRVVQQQNDTTGQTDFAAGTDKAALQLADGTTVQLNNTQKRRIALEGNASIDENEGELLYLCTEGNSSSAQMNTLSTPRGGQYKLTLSDGTKVWLNAASSIKYSTYFSANERIVELTGEAYFEVAENKAQPFRVRIGSTSVKVLGTSFNVNAYPNESGSHTTLIEGSVLINSSNRQVRLKPGQQAKVEEVKKQITVNNVDVNDVIAWQKGLFKFRNANLSQIARQLSRWYNIDITTVEGKELTKLGGGINRKLPLSKVLKLLEANGFKYKWENGKLILFS